MSIDIVNSEYGANHQPILIATKFLSGPDYHGSIKTTVSFKLANPKSYTLEADSIIIKGNVSANSSGIKADSILIRGDDVVINSSGIKASYIYLGSNNPDIDHNIQSNEHASIQQISSDHSITG